MDTEKEKQKLRDDYLALDQIGAVLDRIQRYQKILLMKDHKGMNNMEKLWLLAFDGLNLKLKPGTQASLLESALLLPVLEVFIPRDIK